MAASRHQAHDALFPRQYHYTPKKNHHPSRHDLSDASMNSDTSTRLAAEVTYPVSVEHLTRIFAAVRPKKNPTSTKSNNEPRPVSNLSPPDSPTRNRRAVSFLDPISGTVLGTSRVDGSGLMDDRDALINMSNALQEEVRVARGARTGGWVGKPENPAVLRLQAVYAELQAERKSSFSASAVSWYDHNHGQTATSTSNDDLDRHNSSAVLPEVDSTVAMLDALVDVTLGAEDEPPTTPGQEQVQSNAHDPFDLSSLAVHDHASHSQSARARRRAAVARSRIAGPWLDRRSQLVPREANPPSSGKMSSRSQRLERKSHTAALMAKAAATPPRISRLTRQDLDHSFGPGWKS